MPKKARQAHIPQQIRKRKPRRSIFGGASSAVVEDESSVAEDGIAAESAAVELPRRTAIEARPHRRLETLSRSRDSAMPLRVLPGQLPVFERAFLVSELKRISVTAGALLALIIFLAFVLR